MNASELLEQIVSQYATAFDTCIQHASQCNIFTRRCSTEGCDCSLKPLSAAMRRAYAWLKLQKAADSTAHTDGLTQPREIGVEPRPGNQFHGA